MTTQEQKHTERENRRNTGINGRLDYAPITSQYAFIQAIAMGWIEKITYRNGETAYEPTCMIDR